MDRTFIVHASLHCSKRVYDNLSLWLFIVKHSFWLYSRLPSKRTGLTPLKLLNNTKPNHQNLLRCHVWGCPVFVLEPKFHNDQNLPKWNKQAHMGQVFGFSGEHSSPVSNVSNLSTEYISPQFHLVFDELFETVIRTKYIEIFKTTFAMICLT